MIRTDRTEGAWRGRRSRRPGLQEEGDLLSVRNSSGQTALRELREGGGRCGVSSDKGGGVRALLPAQSEMQLGTGEKRSEEADNGGGSGPFNQR